MKSPFGLKHIAEPIRFVFVGALATVIQYTVYWMLLEETDASVAMTFGYAVSLTCNFILTTYFTFSTHPTKKKASGFLLSHAVNYLLQLLTLNVFLQLGIPKAWAPIPIFAICVPVNFVLVRYFVKDKRK